MNLINVYVEICRDEVELPEYAREGDAGMDVRAAEDVIIESNTTKIVPTGLKVAIPEGYEIQVRPRSGVSFKTPLRVSNSPGTIDSGYRDEIGIIISNTSKTKCSEKCSDELLSIDEKGNKQGTYHIKKGDRIAQFVLQRVPKMDLIKVESVATIGNDRGGGFGSSGVR